MNTIKFKEFLTLYDGGKRAYTKNQQPIKVQIICTDCGRKHLVVYKFLARRKTYIREEICSVCASKRTPSVSYANALFRQDLNYKKKLSRGVKEAIAKRDPEKEKERIKNLIDYNKSAKRRLQNQKASLLNWQDEKYIKKTLAASRKRLQLEYKNLRCDSIAEYAFLQWIENKVDKIDRCNFSIKYLFEGREHNYVPDFICVSDDEVVVYEIKGVYKRVLDRDNSNFKKNFLNKKQILAKRSALKEFCRKVGWKERMITFDNKDYARWYKKIKRQIKYENKK